MTFFAKQNLAASTKVIVFLANDLWMYNLGPFNVFKVVMEVEQLNQIANRLTDLAERQQALRGYL